MILSILNYPDIYIEEKTTIGKVLQKSGIYTPSPCGGRGSCGKCRIRVVDGHLPVTDADRVHIPPSDLEKGVRLACMAEADPETSPASVLKVELMQDQEEDIFIPETEDGSSEYLSAPVTSETEGSPSDKFCGDFSPEDDMGLAFDIGTTTIAVSLIDLTRKTILGTAASVNHQRSYGADVVSRIRVSSEGCEAALTSVLRNDVYNLSVLVLKRFGIPEGAVKKMVIAGNSVMQHSLMGYSLEGFSRHPFRAVSLKEDDFPPERVFGRAVLENAVVTMLPGISPFVGADIISGLFLLDINSRETPLLLIDLGTNGEMALGDKSGIAVSSVAAGPAFEGGNISCGTGSIPGAVCSVTIEGERPLIKTIGNKEPVGLCGTGVIETVSELLRNGIMDATGLLAEPWFKKGFPLAPGISFTQDDIREFQMAKAAVRTGLQILTSGSGISFSDIGRVFIAGGMGHGLDLKKASLAGLIPSELLSITEAVGNASLKGAVKFLLSGDAGSASVKKTASLAREIPLAEDAEFNEAYIDNIDFS